MVDPLVPDQSRQSDEHIEMEVGGSSRSSSRQRLFKSPEIAPRSAIRGVARHTIGMILLLLVVFLWTLSNFLGSSIFADNTYAKPFFLTYLNTSAFMLAMIPTLLRTAYKRQQKHGDLLPVARSTIFGTRQSQIPSITVTAEPDHAESEAFIKPDGAEDGDERDPAADERDKHLGIIPTARLSLAFCFLWFAANYFAMACLQYTTVASTTILTSTASFWTLLIGAATGIEKFTWRKLCGVLGSLVGIILISRVDLSSRREHKPESQDAAEVTRMLLKRITDTFPDKPPSEHALGDALALLSAIIYGVYTITLKKSSIKALPRSLNMPLFFGLVGVFNLILLFPLFPILHWTGLEPFQLPQTKRIWTILLANSVSSLFSDICWAYAMVFTSPLVVTVGLSLTIPLSLVGEMVLQGHYEGWVYWLGACIVVASFMFVDHEEREEEAHAQWPETESGADGLLGQPADTVRSADGRFESTQGQSWWDRFRSGGNGDGGGSTVDDDVLDSSDSD